VTLRIAGTLVAVFVLALAALGTAAAAGLVALVAPGLDALSAEAAPSGSALADIPPRWLPIYEAAAATCPGLPWPVLAAIGKVETDQGHDDVTSQAGAEGPMQFLPSTFAAYAEPVPPGGADPPTPFDPTDAIYAAARMLCANGARDGADIPGALFAYNHSEAYVSEVLADAATYTAQAPPAAVLGRAAAAAAAAAVRYALGQVGTPYRFGGETPGVGFDCSGLTQAAYAAAGIAIPRTSEAQWAALPHVPLDALEPGDLVFFEPGEFVPGLPGHVGIYLGGGEMVDAPHTGAVVRIDRLADWPEPFGAARPVALLGATAPPGSAAVGSRTSYGPLAAAS
jgi:cell wall-associated NlpC family hydrolase